MAEPFGPFELERLLGRGGMAEAFIARRRDDPEDRELVLKRMRPELASDAEYLQRFVLEAQVASRVIHPNLVRFLEFGQVGACRYLALEMIRGYSLHRVLERAFKAGGAPPLAAALSLVKGILDGLATMHRVVDERGRPRPMLHRDVTPSNVIVAADGRPVIIDFGITKDVHGPQITLPGRVIGTARYMSPEHRRAEFIDPRADVFSASVIMFELMTGAHPWPPLTSVKELLRVTFDPPEVPEAAKGRIPAEIRAVMLRGLECDREHRFEDAAAMSEALARCPGFEALAADGRTEVVRWIERLGLDLDEELGEPVLDLGNPEAPLTWTPAGVLSTGETEAEDPTIPLSRVLTLPPLPPRRDEGVHEATDDQLVAVARRSKAVWVWPAVAAAALLVLGGVMFAFADLF